MSKKKWTSESERHAFYLSKKIDKAVREHDMISDGDRILVGISGGKDSLSLLRLLLYRLKSAQKKYTLIAAHVRGDARGADIEVPQSLIDWVQSEGVPMVVHDIILPQGESLPMDCERCGRNRRRTLFEIAKSQGCNKLALGHHLEDFAHTALLNLFYSGRLETMAYKRVYFDGLFTLIRPLSYIKENELVRFARSCELPVAPADCPMAEISRRKAVQEMMMEMSREFRAANYNIVRAAGIRGE